MNVRRMCIVAALAWSVAGRAAGQETVTLEEALTRALQQSGRLAEIEARRAGAEAAEAGTVAARLPQISVLGGYTRTNHVDEFGVVSPGPTLLVIYPDIPDNVRSRVDLQWPIYTGGRTEALERAARAEKNALGEDLEAARADLRLEVTRAFWAAVTAREAESVLARAVQRMDAQVADLKARLDQGLIPPNELTAAEAQRSRQQVLAIEARNIRQVADADLRRLIGGSGPLTPVGDLGTATFLQGTGTAPRVIAPEIEALPAEKVAVPEKKVAVPNSSHGSSQDRAERRGLEERLGSARAREEAAQGTVRPQIAAVAGYDYARPNPRIFPREARWQDSWDVGVNLSWTLWDGGRRHAEQAEASAATRAVQARIVELERQITFELAQRQHELDSARAAIPAATDGVRSALETQRVLDERYRAGVATSTEVLDAEIALLQAELERTRALANERLAVARLERARGR